MQQYDFSDALRLMKEGKYVTRIKWRDKFKYQALEIQDYNPNHPKPIFARYSAFRWYKYELLTEDILATDWIIYEG